jgi:DNA-binding MarR family transcriptional regulator
MQALKNYIKEVLGIHLETSHVAKDDLADLPLYIRESYQLFTSKIYDEPLVLAELKEDADFSNLQIEKHLNLLCEQLTRHAILVTNNMTAINRKRLIEKSINFIVPGKQLFLPGLLLDLRESFTESKSGKVREKLLPSAQYILLYYILHRENKITNLSFKELAEKLGYTQMAITYAVESLKLKELCEVSGAREKYIHFELKRNELWHMAQPYLVSPVLKKIYVDEKPNIYMLGSNESALSEYSDVNPPSQKFYALEKAIYYGLLKSEGLINENEHAGRYCLEIWKYNPLKLAENITEENNVDPLSLYLSLKNEQDERIEIALDQIIEKYIYG